MRLVTYQKTLGPAAETSVGALLGAHAGDLIDVSTLVAMRPRLAESGRATYRSVEDVLVARALNEVADALAWFTSQSEAPDGFQHRLDDVSLLPPVRRPTKVIGVGMNYRSFISQVGEPTPPHPILFHKTCSALHGHRQAVVIPDNTDQAVPEGELAVIIGRRASRIGPDETDAYIAGFACANDISARNLEFQTSQWTSGKMLPTFGPLGPALVTRDEISDVNNLALKTVLNGQTIQHGNTGDMTFCVQDLVGRISMLVDLEIGDVILTGTPSDLGALIPPVYLMAGDTVGVQIQDIGELENPVIANHVLPRQHPVLSTLQDN